MQMFVLSYHPLLSFHMSCRFSFKALISTWSCRLFACLWQSVVYKHSILPFSSSVKTHLMNFGLNRYVTAGTAWLNGAFGKVAKAGQVAGSKTREKWSMAVSNLTAKVRVFQLFLCYIFLLLPFWLFLRSPVLKS